MNRLTWRWPTRDVASDVALASRLGVSRVLAALLRNRGLDGEESARAYLQPRLRALAHPSTLKDMDKAAERLRRALRDGERILVYGDYDVDGMTGTVILLNFIRLCGGDGTFYIPNRLKEGYSFNDEALDAILGGARRPGVVITVDHGISAHQGIAKLAAAGVDVIVTDHHQPPAILPEGAAALVNPHRLDCESPFKSLCGAAVAYKLAWGAAEAWSGERKLQPEFREFLLDAMGMVALATVTDVVPLRDENRVLCFHGLRALAVSENPGLRALISHSRLRGEVLRAVHIGFRLGPRLNAAGRMGMAEVAIELLTTPDTERAKTLARRLEAANDQRRLFEKEMLAQILALPDMQKRQEGTPICLGRRGWHPGVIGIVASRLVDRFHVPVLLCALDGRSSRGSSRSVAGVNVKVCLDEAGEHTLSHGGHPQAAGATIDEAAFPAFQRVFVDAASRAIQQNGEPPGLDIDLEMGFRDIRPELIEELEQLAPHGEGNPPALFCTRDLEVVGKPQIVGKDRRSLAFHVRHDGRTFRVFAPGQGDLLQDLRRPGLRVDMAYRLKFDSYREPGSIELEAVSIRLP